MEDMIKKQKEYYQAYPIFNKLGLDGKDVLSSEKPDFIFQWQNKTIGLEVVECHPSTILGKKKESLAMADSRLDMICREYEAKLLQEEINHVRATLAFTDRCKDELQRRKVDLIKIRNDIFEEIRKHRERDEFPNPTMWYCSHDRDYCTFKYVESCEIRPIPNCKTFVVQTKMFVCKTVEDECIQHCIAQKEKKLAEYVTLEKNKDIAEYWLCINVPIDTGRFIDYVDYKHRSAYQRVYLTQNSDVMLLDRINE